MRDFIASTLVVAFAATLIGAQSPIVRNAEQVGFVDMSSGFAPLGVGGYRTAGKRYALVCRNAGGLDVVDTTDPTAPTVVANVPGGFRRVVTHVQYAIATTDNGPTAVIDMTDPVNPAIVATIGVGAHSLQVDGTRLYLCRQARGMLVYDLTTPTAPNAVGVLARVVHACNPEGNILYVHGQGEPPTEIFDATNPAQLVSLGGINTGKHSSDLYLAPGGKRILCTCDDFSGGHLQFWDVATPASPVLVGRYQTDASIAIHDIDVKGAYVYVCYYKDQFRVVDVSDVTNPREVAAWDTNPANIGPDHSDMFQTYPFHDAVYMTQMGPTPLGPKVGLHVIDFFPAFGAGAPGTGSVVPTIRWSFGPPSPGNTEFALRLRDARPGSVALLAIGASRAQWGARALPTTLGDFGAPNVTLHVSPDALIPVGVDAQGEARVALPVPAGIRGLQRLYAQWIVLDPGAPNATGIAASEAGELLVY